MKAEEWQDKMIDQFSPGYNIGHSFDTGAEETALGNPIVTKEFIRRIKEEGFKSVRIPITWSGHFDENDMIVELFLKRIDQMIKEALENDLSVIINMQGDSYEWFCHNEDTKSKERFLSLWSQIAEHYKEYSNQLCFELIKEPYFEGLEKEQQWKQLEEYYTGAIEAIRNTGSNNTTRLLFLSPLHAEIQKSSVEQLSNYIQNQSDKNLAASITYEGMWEFSVNCAGVTQFNKEVNNHIIEAFQLIKTYFIDKQIGVVCTEYGLMGYQNHSDGIKYSELLKWYDAVNTYAKQYQIPLMLWDAGRFIDRYNYNWNDKTFQVFIKESYKNQHSYANTDRIYIKKNEPRSDQVVVLQLHNTELLSIRNEGSYLVEGVDYTYENSKLVLKKEYIEKVCNKGLGINGTLNLSFKNGTFWPLTIIEYDTPILESTNGTQEEFVIPVQFQEDTLLSMEAIYDDKTVAGPMKWSPYQEYGYTFEPNYNMGVIYLKQPFLSQIEENKTVTLQFHFYSGTNISYQIIRKGEEIVEVNFKEGEEQMKPEVIVPNVTKQPVPPKEELELSEVKKQAQISWKTAVFVLSAFLISLISIVSYLWERYTVKRMFERLETKKD